MNDPRHIVLVNVHFAPDTYGGATIVAQQVARRLAARGIRVSAIAAMAQSAGPSLPPYTVVRSRQDGIDTYRIALPPGPSHVTGHSDARAARRVLQLVSSLRPDLVHLHCLQGLGVDFLPGLRAKGIRTILSIHDFWWLCERQFMVRADGRFCGQDPVAVKRCAGCVPDPDATVKRQAHLFEAVSGVDLVTFPSAYAHGLCLRSGLPARRAVIWENGVTPPGAGFFSSQQERRRAEPPLTFGFLGGPSSVKGWPLIRTAFQRLTRSDFEGVVVDASLDGSWWRPAMLSGMRGHWRIHPRFEQGPAMDGFYAGIDVLLFLSQWREAFGLTVREALTRGVRVIQTTGGGADEHRGQTRSIPIGAGPERLVEVLETELSQHGIYAPPVPCRTYDEQTAEFLDLVRRL